MSDQSFNFEALEDMRQANVRKSQYRLKKMGPNQFSITGEGKSIIGYDATRGVNVKFGNGVVVIGCIPKEDPRCTPGILNGLVGKLFTSSELAGILERQGITSENDKFEFVYLDTYQDIKYFKIVPSTPDTIPAPQEGVASVEDSEEDSNPADEEAPQTAAVASAPAEEVVDVSTKDDEF